MAETFDKCPHCNNFNTENRRCTRYLEDCQFEPTEDCINSEWWNWLIRGFNQCQ